jgi:hypothetical protein
MFRFPGPVTAAVTAGKEAYLAAGEKIYHMRADYPSDDGERITARLKTRVITRRNQVLLKRVAAKFDKGSLAEVRVRTGERELMVRPDGHGDIAFSDYNIAYSDHDPIVPQAGAPEIRSRCNIRGWEIAPEIIAKSSSLGISLLELEIAEV